MPTFPIINAPTSKSHRIDHEARIQAAITDLESQTRKNYTSITKKWNIERITLVRRFRGEMGQNRDTISYAHKQLTDG
jgi:hypothetical protein